MANLRNSLLISHPDVGFSTQAVSEYDWFLSLLRVECSNCFFTSLPVHPLKCAGNQRLDFGIEMENGGTVHHFSFFAVPRFNFSPPWICSKR